MRSEQHFALLSAHSLTHTEKLSERESGRVREKSSAKYGDVSISSVASRRLPRVQYSAGLTMNNLTYKHSALSVCVCEREDHESECKQFGRPLGPRVGCTESLEQYSHRGGWGVV